MVFVILLILVSIATVGSGAGVLNAITGGAKIVGMDVSFFLFPWKLKQNLN